jgi:branched-chain amino acid transport system substrate-binding protein
MNKNTKRILAIVGSSALVIGAFVSTSAQAAVSNVTLVFQGPLTGSDAETGQDELLGAKTAVAIYNATNPAVTVTLKTADDQGDGAVAGTVAPGVASNKAVVGIIGPAYSGASIASFPSYKSAGLTMVSPSATRVSLTDPKSPDNGFPFFHRVLANDSIQAPALAKWAISGVTSPKVYLVDDTQAYSTGLRDYMVKQLAAQSTVPVAKDQVPNNTSDYTSEVSKVKGSGANVVIYCGYAPDAGKFLKALRDGGWTGKFASGDGSLVGTFITGAGASNANGSHLTAAAVPFELIATPAQLAAFTKATGVASPAGHTYVTETFNATNIFLQCIAKGKVTRPGIQACVSTNTFNLAGGKSVAFSRYGEIAGGAPVGLFSITAGAIKYEGLAQ